jgi:hypothetical protein
MKKLLLVFAATFFLTGCFGSGTTISDITSGEKSTNPNFNLYETAGFSIEIPKDWEIIDSKTFTSNVPAETIVGFRNNLRNEVFTSNVNVSQSKIPEETTSADFGKSTVLKAKESLVGFKELSKEDLTIKISDTEIQTFISGFEGKKSPADPIINFKQLYISYKGAGYVITGAYLPIEDESVVKMIDAMLHSFSLK